MKKSELREMIKEETKKILKEGITTEFTIRVNKNPRTNTAVTEMIYKDEVIVSQVDNIYGTFYYSKLFNLCKKELK